MGRHRQQPESTVLRDYCRRTAPARHRESRVGSYRVHHAHAPERTALAGESPMATFRESLSRLWGTLRRRRTDSDLEEELRLHLELAADEARRRGESTQSAARASRILSGGVAQAMEAMRDQRGLPWLQDLASDLSYGCRILARNPGFTIIAVVSLAIGIGANTAVFSFADTLLLRPLTVPR